MKGRQLDRSTHAANLAIVEIAERAAAHLSPSSTVDLRRWLDAKKSLAPLAQVCHDDGMETTTTQVRIQREGEGYGVYVDGERVGHVHKRPGRSFSGAWVGTHSSGRSAGSRHFTRQAAVDAITRGA